MIDSLSSNVESAAKGRAAPPAAGAPGGRAWLQSSQGSQRRGEAVSAHTHTLCDSTFSCGGQRGPR